MGETSIPCSEETRNRLRQLKERRDVSWNDLLQQMADEVDPDAITSTDLEARLDDLDRRVRDIESQMTRR